MLLGFPGQLAENLEDLVGRGEAQRRPGGRVVSDNLSAVAGLNRFQNNTFDGGCSALVGGHVHSSLIVGADWPLGQYAPMGLMVDGRRWTSLPPVA